MADANLSKSLQDWKALGHQETFRDYEIHCYYRKGSKGPLLLLLHGYPNSSYDWRHFIELEKEYSILTFDFLGFGFSSKPTEHEYLLTWQADLAEELVSRHGGSEVEVFVLGHDMGTSVATELFARDIDKKLKINLVGGIVFNGNMDMRLSSLILGQKLLRSPIGGFFARLSFSAAFRWQLGTVFGKKYPMTQEEGENQWTLLSYNNGHRINNKLIRYTFERERLRDRWLGAISNWEKPLGFAWGMEDPVATTLQFNGLKKLRPNAPVSELQDLGHFPQIENAEQFYPAIKELMSTLLGPK